MDLDGTYNEILSYAQSLGLPIYRADSTSLNQFSVLLWANEQSDWRMFVDVAKEAGARYLLVSKEADSGKTGRISAVWPSDGFAHAYVEQDTSWVKSREQQAPAIKWEISPGEEDDQKLREAIKLETIESLAEQLVSFIQSSFPNDEPWAVRQRARLFWQTKGSRHGYYADDVETQMKMQQAEGLAQRGVEESRWAQEKLMIPQLADECVEWAQQRELKRLTKSNADYFLREKGTTLSQLGRDALYNEVNFRLGR